MLSSSAYSSSSSRQQSSFRPFLLLILLVPLFLYSTHTLFSHHTTLQSRACESDLNQLHTHYKMRFTHTLDELSQQIEKETQSIKTISALRLELHRVQAEREDTMKQLRDTQAVLKNVQVEYENIRRGHAAAIMLERGNSTAAASPNAAAASPSILSPITTPSSLAAASPPSIASPAAAVPAAQPRADAKAEKAPARDPISAARSDSLADAAAPHMDAPATSIQSGTAPTKVDHELEALQAIAKVLVQAPGSDPATTPTTDALSLDTSASSSVRTGLLCVIISGSHSSSVDYITDLSKLLQTSSAIDHVAVYDTDDVSLRSFPYVDTIVEGPHDKIQERIDSALKNATLNAASATLAHKPSPYLSPLRLKQTLDYSYALSHAYQVRDSYPYVLVIEDDTWFAKGYDEKLRELLMWKDGDVGTHTTAATTLASSSSSPSPSSSSPSNWWSWTLLHCSEYEHPPPFNLASSGTGSSDSASYQHGSSYVFRACPQGLLFRTDTLHSLITYLQGGFSHDGFSTLLQKYQAEDLTQRRMNVAVPSILQHITHAKGSSASLDAIKPGSSTTTTSSKKQMKTEGCRAFDFTEYAEIPQSPSGDEEEEAVEQIERVHLKADALSTSAKL